ncbi:MAG: M23 family metallopeptidase [Anaerolineae bacterium]
MNASNSALTRHGYLRSAGFVLAAVLGLSFGIVGTPGSAQQPTTTPVTYFRSPVDPGNEVSSLFDHDPAPGSILFYDGRSNADGGLFYFSCPQRGGGSVGCEQAATDEASCPDDAEMWYDNHHGIDYEFSSDWRTGDSCDLSRFDGISQPVYAAAAGRVAFVGYGRYNGNYVILMHDYNGDGDYSDDGLRTLYLHFETGGIVVSRGQVVAAGELLGTGGMTGLAWTPHLHFEVQRYTDGAWRAVDPYGWLGTAGDPWPVAGEELLAREASAP